MAAKPWLPLDTTARFDFQAIFESGRAQLASSGGIGTTLGNRRVLTVAETSAERVRSLLQFEPPGNTALGVLLLDGYVTSRSAYQALFDAVICE